MHSIPKWLTIEHGWPLVVLTGFVCLLAGLCLAQILLRRRAWARAAREQNLLLDTALNNMSQGLCMFDAQARLVVCNRRYVDMYGLFADVVKPGCALRDLLRHRIERGSFWGDPDRYSTDLRQAIACGQTTKTLVESKDGRIFAVVNQPMTGGGWVATHEDITELRRAEMERDRNRIFLDTLIEHMPITVTVKDARDGRYVLVNRAAEALFSVPRGQMLGKRVHDVFPKAEADFFSARDREVMQSPDRLFVVEHAVNTPHDGTHILTTKKLAIRGENGEPRYLLGLSEDITEQKRAEERIAYLAHHDPLTDLPNRAAFNQQLSFAREQALAAQGAFAVLCLDIDRFKEVNDVFGHAAGDALLRDVAKRLAAAADGAFLARLGADEFAFICSQGAQPAAAAALAQRVQSALAADLNVEGYRRRAELSIGVAIFPTDGADSATLFANAGAALDRAKEDGRGAIHFFAAAMDLELRERRALQHDLQSAIARNELTLHYQPQARVDGEIVGFEALARWQHPTRGAVAPGTFIPLAEESGLIVPMSEWILRAACREAASWPRNLQIAVNLSPVQFRHGDLAGLVHTVLLETGLSPDRLELEVTEGVLIDDFSRAVSILRRLKSLGVRIAMDDFGTAYSSLSYLQSFPFDKIKIDQAFISNVERNRQSAAIARAIIALARVLGLPVLAEGVETKEQLAFLAREGCDEVQGYLIGRPRPIAEYASVLARRPRSRKKPPTLADETPLTRVGRR
ncbi:MAG TPA: EAL domain-containing protein [Xanthobacteraceae bacterium]|nr:EAL domain-containing protein [Xanthobacteraceae bacterium]